MLSWKTHIDSLPKESSMAERRAYNKTVQDLALNRVPLKETILLAAHDAHDGGDLAGGGFISRMFSTDLIDYHRQFEEAKLEFYQSLPDRADGAKMEKVIDLCTEILKNPDYKTITKNPTEVKKIVVATAKSNESSLYGRLRSVFRVAKGVLTVTAVAAIVYFVYLWATGQGLPEFLSQYGPMLNQYAEHASQVVAGLKGSATAYWDAAKGYMGDLAGNLSSAARDYAGSAAGYVGDLASTATGAARDYAGSAAGYVGDLASTATGAANYAGAALGSAGDLARNATGAALDYAGNATGAALDYAGNLAGNLTNGVNITAFGEGLKNMLNSTGLYYPNATLAGGAVSAYERMILSVSGAKLMEHQVMAFRKFVHCVAMLKATGGADRLRKAVALYNNPEKYARLSNIHKKAKAGPSRKIVRRASKSPVRRASKSPVRRTARRTSKPKKSLSKLTKSEGLREIKRRMTPKRRTSKSKKSLSKMTKSERLREIKRRMGRK